MKNIKFMVWLEGGCIQSVKTNFRSEKQYKEIEFEIYDADSEERDEVAIKWDYDISKWGMNDKYTELPYDNAADIIRHNNENNS
jgi:hypothetical protein